MKGNAMNIRTMLKRFGPALVAWMILVVILTLSGCVSTSAQVERRVYAERQVDESVDSANTLAGTAAFWFSDAAATRLALNLQKYESAKRDTGGLIDPREAQFHAEKYTSTYYLNLIELAKWESQERARIESQRLEAIQNAEGSRVVSGMADNEARVTTTTGKMVMNSAISLGTGILSDWASKAAPQGTTTNTETPAPSSPETPTTAPTLK